MANRWEMDGVLKQTVDGRCSPIDSARQAAVSQCAAMADSDVDPDGCLWWCNRRTMGTCLDIDRGNFEHSLDMVLHHYLF